MRYKTIDRFYVKGKIVLLRSDLNSPVVNGQVIDNPRIEASTKTIKELQKRGARVVVLAHQSRPGKQDFIALDGHAKLLNKYCKIRFVEDVIEKKAVDAIKEMKNGGAVLLDNVRGVAGEMSGGGKIVSVLGKLGEIYINDAFSVSHRKQASVTGLPRKMKKKGIGRLMESELANLGKLDFKKGLFILGGAKVEENLLLMKRIFGEGKGARKGARPPALNNVGKKISGEGMARVLLCGVFGQLCVISSGNNLGAQNKFLRKELIGSKGMKKYASLVETPIDFAVKVNGKRKELSLCDFPSKYEIYDIGRATMANYVDEIKKAKFIFMKGPAGYCEDKQFCLGTYEILQAIANSRAHSVLAGGHTSSAAAKAGIDRKKFNYISLSGGALVRYLVDGKLVGLKVLEKGR